MSQISTIVDSSRQTRGCPGLGRGFFIPTVLSSITEI
nr:MAG TPA: hypothetical protein [Caudoviricetes sp.]